ncbi:hypothetical protein ACQWHL_25075, partial [Salmonella enterica subsp. enterica serovar Infantis]
MTLHQGGERRRIFNRLGGGSAPPGREGSRPGLGRRLAEQPLIVAGERGGGAIAHGLGQPGDRPAFLRAPQ